MKKYIKNLSRTIDTSLDQQKGPTVSAPGTSSFIGACRLGCILFAVIFAAEWSLLGQAAQSQNHVEITSITPVQPGRTNLLITWEGSIPPYKLQVKNEVTAPWYDATYHIYTNYYVVNNPQPGAFYRVRTIPDRNAPPSIKGFGPRQVDCNQVRFTWDAPVPNPFLADTSGGTGLRGYRIYRDGSFLIEIPFPTAEFVDTTVAGATTYSYWASAVDVVGNESPRSGTRVVETLPCNPDPDPDPSSGVEVTLSWGPNTQQGVTGYVLRYGLASGNYAEEVDVGNVTTSTMTELVSGSTYYFAVSAYDADGLEGDASSEVSFLVP